MKTYSNQKPHAKYNPKPPDRNADSTISNPKKKRRNTRNKFDNPSGQVAHPKFEKYLSDKGKRALSLMNTELSDAQIGHAVGLSRERVRQLRKRSGRPPSTHSGEHCSTFTEERLGVLIREIQGHKSLSLIAQEMGTTDCVIQSICRRFHIDTGNRTTYRLLTKHHSLKVTTDEFLAFFREHLNEPYVRRVINRHFGLSNACAYLRVKRMYKRGQITDEEYAIMKKNARKRTTKKQKRAMRMTKNYRISEIRQI